MAATPAAVLASGADATTAGFYTSTGTEPASDLDAWINYVLDIVAQRTSAVAPIAKGGTGATTAAAARANLALIAANVPTVPGGSGSSTVQADLDFLGASVTALSAGKADLSMVAAKANTTDLNWVQQGNLTADVYNRVIGGSYRVAYIGSTGLLGYVPSTRTLKQDIETATIDVQAVLALDVVTFRYKADPGGPLQHGLIAEDLDALGLTWLVDYGSEGDTPQGVRYDLLSLALIPAIRSAHQRLDAIEAHLDAVGSEF